MRITGYILAFVCLLQLSFVVGDGRRDPKEDEFLYGHFPDHFMWGFATASYQIEGGWDADGKGENIWDRWTHRPLSPIIDGSTGDVACDSYNKYAEDVELLKNMGADYYRFSISWSRILPLGTLDVISQPGIDYYNNLINLLLENGIKPMVTMYHWDLPQPLQDIGGWPNEELIEHFSNYARLIFNIYGDRVKYWITFNEPFNTCELGYGLSVAAPGYLLEATQPYLCAHTIIKSHARAYRMYESEFKGHQNGRVGITIDSEWMEPSDPLNPVHVAAASRAIQFKHGWFASPIFFGKYPDIMREQVDRFSEQEGRNTSRLPSFDAYWSDYIRGTWDFLGLNHYTTELTIGANLGLPGWVGDQRVTKFKDPTWPGSAAAWLKKVPWGFRKFLNYVKDTYGNPEVFITENGWCDNSTLGLNDEGRMDYFTSYINEVLKAITLDGCNISSYTAWSLMDNFEWANGYTHRFGVYWVNFTDPERQRIPKESTNLLRQIFSDNGFPEPKHEDTA